MPTAKNANLSAFQKLQKECILWGKGVKFFWIENFYVFQRKYEKKIQIYLIIR